MPFDLSNYQQIYLVTLKRAKNNSPNSNKIGRIIFDYYLIILTYFELPVI
ncbi:hypothetical protein LDI01_24690 [Lentilactobacillus diolivorans]|uniref:Transposase n=1 Tax=Lentilactobacillus diolivorans TaxID=179838 RepID=A0ABQ0XFM9_9LACO|nr:hypothetical protein LDI01_24690 [Lentilactobacillus diolivorans]